MLDEKNERIRMPTKNKRARPWLLEIRYLRGIGIKWGWRKMGKYRTEAEASKAGEHYQRNWHNDMEVRVSRLDNVTKA
jgi:hypothetical protein